MANSAISNSVYEQPFPDLAAALQSAASEIAQIWVEQVRRLVPSARELSESEVVDHVPLILPAMVRALTAGLANHDGILLSVSPQQGLQRFRQHYEITDLMTEDRALRQIILEQTGKALGRPMSEGEYIVLNTAVDLMLHQSIVAFANEQKSKLRSAAEAELKYLSFLSHDLNNNLNSVTLMLQLLQHRLSSSSEFAEDVETLDAAQQAILDTIGGMGRLLQSERLRKSGMEVQRRPVDLNQVATAVVRRISGQAEKKKLSLLIEMPDPCMLPSDGELIGLILQNLLGNAVKYSSKGTIRIGAVRRDSEFIVSVSDEGPGIAAEHLDRIFDSFRRGEQHGQSGIGLGLTIASQAAKLLGAELTVESTVGAGSIFKLILRS